ncbi:hypothetical protein GY45DRAFT_1060658 [Cubamyces sp. BRFM 1775]|nr:hypothetical protein GY45DRAFT_1060658 [Cubamyces sp. BRFM 1775]
MYTHTGTVRSSRTRKRERGNITINHVRSIRRKRNEKHNAMCARAQAPAQQDIRDHRVPPGTLSRGVWSLDSARVSAARKYFVWVPRVVGLPYPAYRTNGMQWDAIKRVMVHGPAASRATSVRVLPSRSRSRRVMEGCAEGRRIRRASLGEPQAPGAS